MFTFQVSPGDIVIKRSRDDLRWLLKNLGDEFPTAHVTKVLIKLDYTN